VEDRMDAKQYGEGYQQHLIEQYKLYVQMADNVSLRRSQSNQFYISVLSALLAVVALAGKLYGSGADARIELVNVAFLCVTILGLIICIVWAINLLSYRQLNAGKFKVIHEMESMLPYACYDREWEFLGRGEAFSKYVPLTNVEVYVPAIMAIPYIIVFLYFVLNMFYY
jgi:hypothetical protein